MGIRGFLYDFYKYNFILFYLLTDIIERTFLLLDKYFYIINGDFNFFKLMK